MCCVACVCGCVALIFPGSVLLSDPFWGLRACAWDVLAWYCSCANRIFSVWPLGSALFFYMLLFCVVRPTLVGGGYQSVRSSQTSLVPGAVKAHQMGRAVSCVYAVWLHKLGRILPQAQNWSQEKLFAPRRILKSCG